MKVFAVNAAVALPIFLAIISIYYLNRFSKSEKAFVYYIIACAFFELLAKALNLWNFSNNLPGLHAYTLVQFVSLSWFFVLVFRDLGYKVRWLPYLIVGSTAILFNSAFIQDIYSFNSYSKTGVELFILLASIAVFILNLDAPLKNRRSLGPVIVFTVSLFIRAAFSIIIYLYSVNIANMAKEIGIKFWLINAFTNILTYLIIAYGINLIIKRDGQVRLSNKISETSHNV